MAQYIEFPLENGGSVVIETADEPHKSGFAAVGAAGNHESAEQAHQSFDQSMENIRKSADLLTQKLHTLTLPPDEMTVTFCLKASSELGALMVGKLGVDSNYNVTLKWRKESPGKDKDDEKKNGDDKGDGK